MTFPYTAWVHWYGYGYGVEEGSHKLYFAKKEEGAWVVDEICQVSGVGRHWIRSTFVQNYGSEFLMVTSDLDNELLIFHSSDGGTSWEDLAHNLNVSDKIQLLDCWQGTWIMVLGDRVVLSSDGETWTNQPAYPYVLPSTSTDPRKICLDEFGVLHCIESDTSDAEYLYYTKSTDLGETWSIPEALHSSADEWIIPGGVGAYNHHVCVGGIATSGDNTTAELILFASHDDGVTWQSPSRGQPAPAAGWDHWQYASYPGLFMTEDFVAVTSGCYNTLDYENDPPYPYEGYWGRVKISTCSMVADYDVVGTPLLVDSLGYLSPEGEGRRNSPVCSSVQYGQDQNYSLGFRQNIPVNTSAGTRETPWTSGYQYWMSTVNAVYVEDGEMKIDILFEGKYPGPHPPNSLGWRMENGGGYRVRFSPWRSPPSGAGAFWW